MSDSRGQTTLDFAIGVSVFLVAVTVVLAFVPGMVQPFSENTQEEMAVADRTATQLGRGMLAGSTASVLDTDCTVEFFTTDATGGATCAFSENDLSAGGTIPGRLGIDARHEIQVHLRGDVDGDGTNSVLCWNETNREVLESGDGACDVTFELETSDPPQSGTVSTAVRVVSLRGYDTTLRVRTW